MAALNALEEDDAAEEGGNKEEEEKPEDEEPMEEDFEIKTPGELRFIHVCVCVYVCVLTTLLG